MIPGLFKNLLFPVAAMAAILLPVGAARAQKVDCLECHKDLTEGKVVHPAVQMGCQSCHTGVDATSVPHKFADKLGLSAQPPDLCFQCHDKAQFTKKVQHAPVAAGKCLNCHTPHSGPNESLLKAAGNALCEQCHAGIVSKPHVVMDLLKSGHVLAGLRDPVREGKRFGCISCHVPHSSDWGKLFRYDAENAPGLCKYCHEFLQ